MFEELKELELLEIDGGCDNCLIYGSGSHRGGGGSWGWIIRQYYSLN